MIPISTAILIGGKNTRMGGYNKAFLEIGGQIILQRMVNVVRSFSDELIFVSNSNHVDYKLFNPDSIVSDIIPNRGPLSGFHAALMSCKNPYCFIFACDLPLLNPKLIEKQIQEISNDFDAIVPNHLNGIEPLHAIYSKQSCQPLENYLFSCSDNKILLFLNSVRTHFWSVDFDQSFVNLNSEEDIRNFQKLL